MAIGPLSIDMYLPALPALGLAFATDAAHVQYTLTSYFVGLALGQIFYGPTADRYGRRRPLLVGLALYTLASAACVVTTSMDTFIALRFFQAAGGCACMVITLAVVRDLFEPLEAARMLSRLMLVMGVAPILAPLAGGYLLIWFGWHAIFLFLALYGAASFIAVFALLPDTRPAGQSGPAGVGSALRSFGEIIVQPRFLGYALAGGFSFAGMFAYIAGSPFVFITLHGISPEAYGWLFGANALGLIAASQLNVRLLRRSSSQRVLCFMLPFQAACGFALLAAAASGTAVFALLLAPLFGYVASIGLIMPNASAHAMAPFGARAGTASALLGVLQFSIATVATASLSLLHNGTAVPLAGVMAASGLLAVAAHRLLVDQSG